MSSTQRCSQCRYKTRLDSWKIDKARFFATSCPLRRRICCITRAHLGLLTNRFCPRRTRYFIFFDSRVMTVVLWSLQDGSIVQFKSNKTAQPSNNPMEACCARPSLQRDEIPFDFDGNRLLEYQLVTPEELKMEVEDVIDATVLPALGRHSQHDIGSAQGQQLLVQHQLALLRQWKRWTDVAGNRRCLMNLLLLFLSFGWHALSLLSLCSLSLSLSLSHTHTHTRKHTDTVTHTLSLSLTHTHTHTHRGVSGVSSRFWVIWHFFM